MSDVEVPHHVANEEHKRVGIFISVLAVLMALISSLARNQANEIIVKEVQASNGFAWYQAKRQRSHLNELELQRAEKAWEAAFGEVVEKRGKVALLGDGFADFQQSFELTPGVFERRVERSYRRRNDMFRHRRRIASGLAAAQPCA